MRIWFHGAGGSCHSDLQLRVERVLVLDPPAPGSQPFILRQVEARGRKT